MAHFLCAKLRASGLSQVGNEGVRYVYRNSPPGLLSNSCSQGKQKQHGRSVSRRHSPECLSPPQKQPRASRNEPQLVRGRRGAIDGGVNRRLMTVEESAGEALQSMKCVKQAMRRTLGPPPSLTHVLYSVLPTHYLVFITSPSLSHISPCFPPFFHVLFTFILSVSLLQKLFFSVDGSPSTTERALGYKEGRPTFWKYWQPNYPIKDQ